MAKVTAADGHTYDKSATANATVAPTNQATLDKVQQKHLTAEHIQFVTIVDYEWNLKRLTDERLRDEYGYTASELNSYYADDRIKEALAERGINVSQIRPEEGIKHAKLSPIQLIVANRLLDLTDNRSDKKKLQDSGVTTLQYSAWLSDPEFTGYMRERAEGLLGSSQHEILLALMDKVKARDTSAIKLALEVTGRHVSQTSGNNGPSQHDVSGIIMRVVEIIIDEVEDQPTAMRIAERLQGLVTGAQIAGVMASPAVVIPEIAQPREITPEVKAMMDQGLGYDS